MLAFGVNRVFALAAAALLAAGCAPEPKPAPGPEGGPLTSVAYQLQDYRDDRLDEIARSAHPLAVIDLARDAADQYFTADEIARVRATGKKVLAYFEIGAIEEFRPEFREIRDGNADLLLNEWPEWPGERFVRYWDPRWWRLVVQPRLDRAIAAGFDGVYLDTPLAYEEIRLELVPAERRDGLGAKMAELIVRITEYARSAKPGFWIFPQNSPELRRYPGYEAAIDGIGMEELFFRATDEPCVQDYCAENLREARALRDAGKLVVAIDYATRPENIATACRRYREEHFAGSVTVRSLDRITAPCPGTKGTITW
ncbi:endo alpha-1,4 polygalactosaminidase [Amycolatopsis anabasis]|uniref:endo alpha-1,4 polygalactosaminidase n=1 Tax=Amycolatopsis anabasis TaxID=1840409 RepID=UPI00131C4DB1|nr:endo alpha-1,4 polygalactosaminidase [Amycolatopsis anabasis]